MASDLQTEETQPGLQESPADAGRERVDPAIPLANRYGRRAEAAPKAAEGDFVVDWALPQLREHRQ